MPNRNVYVSTQGWQPDDTTYVTERVVARWADTFVAYSAIGAEVRTGPLPADPVARDEVVTSCMHWLAPAIALFEPVYFELRKDGEVIHCWGEERPAFLRLTPEQFQVLQDEWAAARLNRDRYHRQAG